MTELYEFKPSLILCVQVASPMSHRSGSRQVTSGIHCMQAAWAHMPGSVVGLRPPPVRGHRQHWGSGAPGSLSSHDLHRNDTTHSKITVAITVTVFAWKAAHAKESGVNIERVTREVHVDNAGLHNSLHHLGTSLTAPMVTSTAGGHQPHSPQQTTLPADTQVARQHHHHQNQSVFNTPQISVQQRR